MTDAAGMKYEFQGLRYRTHQEINAALSAYLGLDGLPLYGKHEGQIVLWNAVEDKFVHVFNYARSEDGVDVVSPL